MLTAMPGRAIASPSFQGLDLEPLYQECLLRSSLRRETYDCIASDLCDYGLTWRGGAVDARAFRARTEKIALYSIQYGDEVSIAPDLYRNFLLVHVALRNGIEVDADGRVTHVPEGSVFFSAPQKRVRLRWQENCEQLLVRIPFDLLFGTDRIALSQSGQMLPPELTPLFIQQLNLLLKISRAGNSLENYRSWVCHVERGVAQFASLLLSNRALPTGEPANPRTLPTVGDQRERLESFIRGRLKMPISLNDLLGAVGLGKTQLNRLCHDGFECSPMGLVRRLRLKAARSDLERSPRQDLTALSLRYGFDHQSRFAQYYREEFGELPRDTRRRLLLNV